MFLLNANGHYFEIDTSKVQVREDRFVGCRIFEDDQAMLETVCAESNLDLDEVSSTTYYVTERHGLTVLIDDRGLPTVIDEPVEPYLSEYTL